LPRVGKKYEGAVSFWTRHGFEVYQSSGLRQWHESVVTQPAEIILKSEFSSSDVLYHDEFQVICSPNPQEVFKLRTTRPNDAGGIAEVHVQSWQEAYEGIIDADFLSSLSVEKRTLAWAKNLSTEDPVYGASTVKVIEDASGKIVGFASGGKVRDGFPNHDSEVYAIYVLNKFKATGLGELLFHEMILALRLRKLVRTALWVFEDNPTRKFYERMGGELLNIAKEVKIGSRDYREAAYGWNR
jgi:ribosomal protein S18 acetylase RimI-like enzyme